MKLNSAESRLTRVTKHLNSTEIAAEIRWTCVYIRGTLVYIYVYTSVNLLPAD